MVPQMDMQGHYEIEKLLGNGSFASVYMVRRRSDGKLFAAKAFLKKLLYQNDVNGRVNNNYIKVVNITWNKYIKSIGSSKYIKIDWCLWK